MGVDGRRWGKLEVFRAKGNYIGKSEGWRIRGWFYFSIQKLEIEKSDERRKEKEHRIYCYCYGIIGLKARGLGNL